jgi:hypothetical protein
MLDLESRTWVVFGAIWLGGTLATTLIIAGEKIATQDGESFAHQVGGGFLMAVGGWFFIAVLVALIMEGDF